MAGKYIFKDNILETDKFFMKLKYYNWYFQQQITEAFKMDSHWCDEIESY